jgi:hypothetical protein
VKGIVIEVSLRVILVIRSVYRRSRAHQPFC